jgi:methylmalonyl-CoA/ethylmalonyl-CoA epimerase
MPKGPLAHICLLVADLDQAVADWRRILGELDPGQLTEPLVRFDRFEAGEDVMAWATFSNPEGCEIQLLAPLNDGPLGRRLARHGEGVHHICFTSPDLPATVERLVAAGVALTSETLSQDPQLPWQWWTFVSPQASHGPLLEIAYPYRAVDGHWEPGERAGSPERDEQP